MQDHRVHGKDPRLAFSQQCFFSLQSTAGAPFALGCRAPIMQFVARATTTAQTHLRFITGSGWDVYTYVVHSIRCGWSLGCLRILQSGAHFHHVRTIKSAWFCTGSGCPGFTGSFFVLLPHEPFCRLFQASISAA
ncbi:unnamed protein product, partial [Ectocarpus sp. 12 AP-2014]